MKDRNTPGSKRWCRPLCGLLLFALLGNAGAAEPTALRLAPRESQDLRLAPAEIAHVAVELETGQAATLSVRQLDAMVDATWTANNETRSPLLRTQAGRLAQVRMQFVAERTTQWSVEIKASKADRAANVRISLSPIHATTVADREIAIAERRFAEAEAIRVATGGVESGRGVEDANAARKLYAEAVAAWTRAGQPCATLIAQIGLARLELQQSRYPQAQSAAQRALAIDCPANAEFDTQADRAAALRTLAAAQGYLGDFEASAANGEAARRLYQATGDQRFEGVVLGNLSAVYRELGATQKALETARAAMEIAKTTGDIEGIAFSRENVANAFLARGELAQALETYRKTLDDLQADAYPMVEGLVWNELGTLYRRLGETDDARAAWARSRAIWEATGNRSGMAETWINEGQAALESGLAAMAIAAFLRALDIAESDHLRNPELNALLGLGRGLLLTNRTEAARERMLAALHMASAIGSRAAEAAAELALGDLESGSGKALAAMPHYRRALELALAMADVGTEAVARASIAQLTADSGNPAQALTQVEKAIDLIEAQHSGIADPMLRTGHFSTWRVYYDLKIDILMTLHAREPENGYARRALEASEWARARSLREQLIERQIAPGQHVEPALLEAERAAEDRQRLLAWRQSHSNSTDDIAHVLRINADIDQARRDADAARGRIRRANPRYAELLHPQALAIAQVQSELLDEDTQVFEYWLGERRGFLWVVTRDRVDAHVLPSRSAIEATATALRERILDRGSTASVVPIEETLRRDLNENEALRPLIEALARQILPSAARPAPLATRVVIADGILQAIPFNLLFANDKDESRSGDTAPVYLPSLATAWGLRALPRNRHARTVTLFADPVLNVDDRRIEGVANKVPTERGSTLHDALAQAGVGQLHRLAYTHGEVRAIADLPGWNRIRMVEGFSLNRKALLDSDWTDSSILHFATHALVNWRRPELSGIVLSLIDPGGNAQDGYLRINDIYRLHLNADLVVLSVCDSATGRNDGAEGPANLARAFFHAGAPRVIATLWPVDDRASAQFMRTFYAAMLKRDLRPQQALWVAQEALRSDPRWRAAYFWSPFVLQGDWR
jgi:CHAT domain-containing protein